jgi:outer membrane receptor protein involved in Fe transport
VGVVLVACVVAAAPEARAQNQSPPAASKSKTPAPAPPSKAAPSKAAPKAAPKTVDTVTVTGESQSGYRTSIDRKSYGIANDLAATTGSISDALKNVPSVEVDVQGNVSLRGDPNVTIMIDGKPSSLFKGPGAAQALQSLPADQFERVEVITNPSAQFSPEGSAGIINLITKQTRRAGRSGSLRANIGTAGRRSFGAGAAYNSNQLTLSGDANWRHDPQHSVNLDDYTALDPARLSVVTTSSDADLRGPLDTTNIRAGADYDLDKASRLSGELRYNAFTFHQTLDQHVLGTQTASGDTVQAYAGAGPQRTDRANGAASANYRRKFAGDDHVLTADLNFEHTDERNDSQVLYEYAVPAQPDLFRVIRGRNGLDLSQFKSDYSRPMDHEGRLKAGYYLRLDDNDYDNLGLRGTSAATAANDPTQTNHYRYRMQLNAGYLTYEQPFGDVTVLGGLRIEDVRLDLDQLTTHQAARQAYTRLYPSLHLADRLTENQQLTLSYSERVSRPGPQDLNPFRFVGTTSARQGNPDLKPQITHSFEAGWQLKDGGTFYLATLYYRRNERGVTDVVAPLGDGILLTTKANLSQSRNAGLELVANGHLLTSLSYNVSTNLYWNEIDASHVPLGPGLGFGSKRSAFTVGGRGSLNWQASAKDLFQVSVSMNAKRLLPQGFQDPMTLVFLGYRHKFTDALSLVVTVQDPTNSYRFRQVIDTPLLKEVVENHARIRAAFIGLTYSFGAARKRPDTFDFGQPSGG